MPADNVLVLDAGTSALRAVAVDRDGNARPVASEPWSIFVPDDAAPFGREFDSSAIGASLTRIVAAIARTGLGAIALAGQREGIVFTDEAGEALVASPNIDARASAEGMAIDANRGEDVYRITGHLPSLMQAPAKLQWLRANRPDIASRVRHVLPLADWLAMRLTGAPAISRSLALENGLLDVNSGDVAKDLLERSGLAPELVPPVLPDGAVAGHVARGGLEGVPVVLAGADTQCALAGMHAVEPGDTGVPAGWSAPVQMVTARPLIDCERRTWTGVHVLPERWVLESNAGETGRAWDWALSITGLTISQAETLAEASSAGASDVMAILGPRTMRASEMNAGIGALTMPLPLVMSSPGRGEMVRAVLESAACSIRANVEQLESVSGTRVARLRLGGGMSRSALFRQILADVLDRPVLVARSPETTALGASTLAFASLAPPESVDESVNRMAGEAEVHPNAQDSATYDDSYERWCTLSDEMTRIAGAG